MSQEFTVTWVGPPREWSNKRGDRFLAYPIKVEGDDREIEWSRKPESEAPEVGNSTPLADIENGSHGPKLKVDWDAVKEQGGGSTSSSGSKNFKSKEWQKETDRDPERAARILRQHSQGMALQLLTHRPITEATDEQIKATLKHWTDHFDADVIQAAQKAGGASRGADSTSDGRTPPAAQVETQHKAEYLYHLLEKAGFPSSQRPILQRYIEDQVEGERRTKLEEALGSNDLDLCAKAVTQLIAETEKWTGEKLPDPKSDNTEIPAF